LLTVEQCQRGVVVVVMGAVRGHFDLTTRVKQTNCASGLVVRSDEYQLTVSV